MTAVLLTKLDQRCYNRGGNGEPFNNCVILSKLTYCLFITFDGVNDDSKKS